MQNSNIATEIDALMRQVVSSHDFENRIFEAINFETLSDVRTYGVDRLAITGKENVSAMGEIFTNLAVGSTARTTETFKPTKLGKYIVINEDEWTSMTDFAKQNIVVEHVQGMLNAVKKLLTIGSIPFINEQGANIILTISHYLANSGKITAATSGYLTDNAVKIFLTDLQAAIARIVNISDSLEPDTLYISKRLWSDLLMKNATSPQSNQKLDEIVTGMGLNVITDGSLNNFGANKTSFMVYQKNPNIIRGFSEEAPTTKPEASQQDISKTFVKQYVGGVHNVAVEDAVQIVADCK